MKIRKTDTPSIAALLCLSLGTAFQSGVHKVQAQELAGGSVNAAVLEPLESPRGKANLRVEPAIVAVGEELKIDCEWCSAASMTFYNAALSEECDLPAQIVIVSADGKPSRGLLSSSRTREPNSDDWSFVYAGESIGRRLLLTITGSDTLAKATPPTHRSITLAPGDYFVQAFYNERLANGAGYGLAPSGARIEPIANLAAAIEAIDAFPPRQRPRAVSKAVKFTVVATTANSQTAHAPSANALQLELRNLTIKGQNASIEVRMTNNSEKAVELYNPFLRRLLGPRQGYSLAVLNSDGTERGNLLHFESGSIRSPGDGDWLRLPTGGTVASRFNFRADYLPGLHFDRLPPGKYFLELRAYAPATAGRPKLPDSPSASQQPGEDERASYQDWLRSFPDWLHPFPRPVICRSNRVELEILPRTGD